jgi:threonine/homoserine/homoserine lactone efflux protein
MPPLQSIAAFAALSFVLIAVPGPSVTFVISRAVALGRRAAVLTVVGNAAGVYVQVVLVALGLGAIVERSVLAFMAIKLLGAAYLVWLGIEAIRDRRKLAEVLDATGTVKSQGAVVRDGFLVGIANPKSIVFFASVLPQFVALGAAPAGLQMALLGVVFVLIALVSDSVWGVAAGTARQWLARSPRRLERLGGAGGFAMIALGLRLAIAGRTD